MVFLHNNHGFNLQCDILIIIQLQPQTPTKLVDDLAEIIKKENDDLSYHSEFSVRTLYVQ